MAVFHDLPGFLIRRLNQISVSIFSIRMAEAGIDLTPVQFAALATVNQSPGLDQATLAGLIAHDRVTIGGVVDRLVAKGLLTREVNKQDRRARVLNLSAAGRDMLARSQPIAVALQSEILGGLSAPERDTFVELLRKATEAGNEHSRVPLVRLAKAASD